MTDLTDEKAFFHNEFDKLYVTVARSHKLRQGNILQQIAIQRFRSRQALPPSRRGKAAPSHAD
jgi:hypothetical protein